MLKKKKKAKWEPGSKKSEWQVREKQQGGLITQESRTERARKPEVQGEPVYTDRPLGHKWCRQALLQYMAHRGT